MARTRHSAGLALAALAAVCCSAPFSRLSSKPGEGAFVHLSAPRKLSAMPMEGLRTSRVMPAATAPQLSSGFPVSALCAAGAAALALIGATRSTGAARTTKAVVMPRVMMYSRLARPTPPMADRGKRRIRAGRKRPIFRGRQIAVRVNPKTNKPVRYRMHVMPGDTVQVMKGKDAGKVTTVLKIYPKWNKILCLGVNYCIKHVRPLREDEVGQRVQVEAPMHSSCVMHYSETEGVAGLLGIRFEKKTLENGKEVVKKVRYNKATGEAIPVKRPQKWVPVLDRTADDEEEEE
eukprot:TRINITY_DN849_c0_g1_i6.p1 TRINITY_DN849_c0_g1~~TRINITY_DN849_c0_g1_i6.p1  ORF type:complete len:291 (+),score=58.89 TRINITY_DN849_c0_g1_i6:112-984(+)